MTPTKLNQRIARLMPRGVPRWIRCYDNGGISAENGSGDRYTVCYTGRAAVERAQGYANEYSYRAMSSHPYDPQGIGLFCSSKNQPVDTMGEKKNHWYWPPAIGRKCRLGTRIKFTDLPADCQRLVIQDYKEIWKLNK